MTQLDPIPPVIESARAAEAAVNALARAAREAGTHPPLTPADLDVVLAHLAETVAAVPQIATQLAGLLEDAGDHYDLAMDDLTPTTDPGLAVDTALLHLDALRHPAVLVHHRIDAARNEVAHVSARPRTPSALSPAAANGAPRQPRPEDSRPSNDPGRPGRGR